MTLPFFTTPASLQNGLAGLIHSKTPPSKRLKQPLRLPSWWKVKFNSTGSSYLGSIVNEQDADKQIWKRKASSALPQNLHNCKPDTICKPVHVPASGTTAWNLQMKWLRRGWVSQRQPWKSSQKIYYGSYFLVSCRKTEQIYPTIFTDWEITKASHQSCTPTIVIRVCNIHNGWNFW